jgi:hypothetical protein
MTNAHNTETLTALATIFALAELEQRIAGICGLTAPPLQPDIIALFHRWKIEPRTVLSRTDCMREGGWKMSTQVEKEKSGALRSFLDGKKRLITVSSFYEHLITRIVLANPAGGPPAKGLQTRTRFQPRRAEQSAEVL